jgi:hypothetical protein
MSWISTSVKVDTSSSILSVLIDGEWKSPDFVKLLTAFDILYALGLPLNNYTSRTRRHLVQTLKSTNTVIKIDHAKRDDLVNLINKLYDSNSLHSDVSINQIEEKFYPHPKEIHFLKEPYSVRFEPQSIEPGFIKIKQINYASPGKVEFEDKGGVLRVVFDIIKYWFPKKLDKERAILENALLAEEVLSKRIANWQAVGFTKTQVKEMATLYSSSVSTLQKQLENAEKKKAVITDILYLDTNGKTYKLNDDEY